MSEFRAGFLSVKRGVGVGAGARVGVDHFFLKNAALRLGWTIILTLTLTLKISSILKKGWTPTPARPHGLLTPNLSTFQWDYIL